MGCGGCGHKYIRPPRTKPVGGAVKIAPQRNNRWRRNVVNNPKPAIPIVPIVNPKPKEG